MSDTVTEPGRGEIEDLLPWYANGRISPVDRLRVEAAVASDAELARRLELVREEMAETIAANEALALPSSRAFDKLMAGIEATPVAPRPLAAAKAGLIDRLGAFVASLAPRRLAYAALAVAAVMVVQAAVLTGVVGERGGASLQTASQGTVATEGPTLLVAFAPKAEIAAIAALLKRHGVGVVEGPKANGFWRLRPTEAIGAEAVKALATKLAVETGLVTFVQVTP